MSEFDTVHLDMLFKVLRHKKRKRAEDVLDIIGTGFFQTTKDLTECLGVVNNLRWYFEDDGVASESQRGILYSEKVHFYVPGDGRDPQCGYMLAKKFPRSTVWSIDPRLRDEYFSSSKRQKSIRTEDWERRSTEWTQKILHNQHLVKDIVENFAISSEYVEISIIVCVHNHGPIQKLYEDLLKVSKRVVVISLPCCTDDSNLNTTPVKEFDDFGILSPKRRIFIWDSSQI